MTIGHHIITYLKAGKLLHIITLIEVFVGIIAIHWLLGFQTSNLFQFGLKMYGMIFFGSLPILAQLDARSRYQNYKQLKDQFILYGYDVRILKPVIKSRCQRDAAILAANRTGYGDQCAKHFRRAGYRWYHLFPDFVLTKPQFLLTPYFWKTTFFCPTYHSKLNHNASNLLIIQKFVNPAPAQHG